MKFSSARVSVLACLCICLGQSAPPRNPPVAGLAAVATNADVNYCYARVRGLDPGRLPPAYLVLQMRVGVSYRNAGNRPLILPLERERDIYTSLKPGVMNKFPKGLLEPSYKPMKELPADVSADSPVSPKNDVFTVIPAGGEMTPPLIEEITLPVNRKALFRNYPDLRGHRLYIRLQFAHRELTQALEAKLSDRWSRFGVPWTGTLRTNTFTVDVPAEPHVSGPCKDTYTPAGTEPPIEGK
jgi:hypothetical protein